MYERAIAHNGFSVIEILSECTEFYPGAFDAGIPRKGGEYKVIEEKKDDLTTKNDDGHDVSDEKAAYRLADLAWPGVFGVFYECTRSTKNDMEKMLIEKSQDKKGNLNTIDRLQKTFDRMK